MGKGKSARDFYELLHDSKTFHFVFTLEIMYLPPSSEPENKVS